MQIRRSQIALLVLLTFVVGSIVAPASHYAYMLFSDVYGVGGHLQHTAHHDVPHHGASHHGAAVDGTHDMPVRARDAGSDHFYCEYADLFATFAATGPLAASVVDATPHSEPVIISAERNPDASLPAAFQQRGPPVPVAHA
ncbi:MAG: hypothetical protein AAF564_19690 [Bacteroidota bacterium]